MPAGKSPNKHEPLEKWKTTIRLVNNQYLKILNSADSSGWLKPILCYRTYKYKYPQLSKVLLELILWGTGANTHII